MNSFSMIKFICRHLGNNAISKEAYSMYRKIYGELIALEQALMRLAGSDVVGDESVGQYVCALLDPNLLPPVAYTDIFTPVSDRAPQIIIGNEVPRLLSEMRFTLTPWPRPSLLRGLETWMRWLPNLWPCTATGLTGTTTTISVCT